MLNIFRLNFFREYIFVSLIRPVNYKKECIKLNYSMCDSNIKLVNE